MPKQRWTDEQLRELVASSTTWIAVLRGLGLTLRGKNHARIANRARELALDTTHFPARSRGIARRWSDEQLRVAVAASSSYAGTIRALGLIAAGGNYDHVHRRVRELGLDVTHFTGAGWSAGRKLNRPSMPLDEVLVAGRWAGSHELKKRLIAAGLKDACCELCGWAERAPDGRVPVELDHINGDKDDNRLENLRIVCPNCHALQPTHRGLNQKRRQRM